MPKYCSLDIETLASNSDAAIIQIGAVSFDPDAKNIFVPEAFEINVSFDPKLNSGFINGNTVQWWLQQSEEARKSVTKAPQVSESEALRSFRDWYILERCTEIWSHSTFDSVVMDNAFNRTGISAPLALPEHT